MNLLIRRARIVCESSVHHGQTIDIYIENGMISALGLALDKEADRIIQQDGLHVSPGWMDIFSDFGEPGFEHRETFETGVRAAAAGGYTDVMLIPDITSPRQSRMQVEFIVQQRGRYPVNLHPVGSITADNHGKELAEMYELDQSGAVAFSDGIKPIQDANILLKAMQYLKQVNKTIIQIPDNQSVGKKGLMNEGVISTRLGLPGKPAFAEELMISRDIELMQYTNSKLHITGVSTRKGIELLKAAKFKALEISASVTPYHLSFCDENLLDYDTNLKVVPPLRTRDDMEALREAINDGTIDCIATQHLPRHEDEKACEFECAQSGMSGLESTFSVVNRYVKDITILISMLTKNPRTIFGLAMPGIEVGLKASLTIFNPDMEYRFGQEHIFSKSANNAFTGHVLRGRVIGIFNNGELYLNKF